MKKLLLFILIPFLVSFAQISISNGGSSVTENFNSMGTASAAALPANWKVEKNANVRVVGNYSGAVSTTNYAGGVNLSSTAGNGVYNFGLSSIDRSIGGLSSGSGSKSVNIFAYFQNNGASTISQVDVSYNVYRFRNGLNTSGFSIQLYYSNDGITWTSAGLDFLSSFAGPNADNNGAAEVPLEKKEVLNQTLSGLNLLPNGALYLAWNYSVTSGTTTSNAQALGIDDFVMNNIGGTTTKPAAPAALAATNISSNSFTANWKSSESATGYQIDVSTNPDFTAHVQNYNNKDVGNAISTTLSLLDAGTTYYYRVRASNSFGSSEYSENISVTTAATFTSVQFNGISDAVIKSAGKYDLILKISDPSSTSATTCSVTFVPDSSTASSSYLNNYSTQAVTFPAGSSADQKITLTIPDNGISEIPKKAFLQIQNVSGGISAQAGTTSKFKLSITSGADNSYYTTISQTLSGAPLKAALHDLIKNCIKYPYTDNSTLTSIDVWKMLRAADEDPKNPDNVVGVYSGWSIAKDPQDYWNREHVWSKSHGNFGTDIGAGTDGHHLRPENPTVNSRKSNLDFDNGGIPFSVAPNNKVATITADGKTTDVSWEPRDEVKGDIARMIFYMATRYTGDVPGEPNLQVVDYIPSSPNNEPLYGKLSTLLLWNQQDPPDAFEINRNNVIYYYQQNRNPYIDHPEWVSKIWGTPSAVQADNSDRVNTEYELYQNYPNPFNPETIISYRLAVGSYVSLKIYDVLGREIAVLVDEIQPPGLHHSQFSTLHSQLTSGIYFYTLNAKSVSGGKEFHKSAKFVLIK